MSAIINSPCSLINRSAVGLRALLIAVVSMFALAGNGCNATTLIFGKYTEIRGEKLRLGDIAEIQDAGEWTSQLANFELGKAPPVGRTERLKSERIMKWVRSRFPQLEDIRWSGASELVLHAATQTIPTDLLLSKARAALETSSAEHAEWVPLDNYSAPSLVVRDIPFELRVGMIRATQECKRVVVRLDAVSGNQSLGSTMIWFKKNVSLKDNAGETTIAASCLRESTGESASAVKPEVSKMDLVTIEVHAPALSLETKGIALGSAKLGETVHVRRLDALDSFMATVTARGRVQIAEEGK
ncbi:MAG: flagella basal body P-ring formation protein FlgA [Pseudomonadota bacterium]